MKRALFTFLLLTMAATCVWAQATFKAGWNTYKTATITREFTYNYTKGDSMRLYLADSAVTLITADSAVMMTTLFPYREKSVYKTITYLNPKKLVAKIEQYKDDNLLEVKEWRYDDKGRKNYYTEENKVTEKNFRKTYDYSTDKKTGETIETENSYYNGRIEFYTKSYYSKTGQKIKEVRLNDNNRDVVHIETYTYGENGRVKERSVYFPEWKVTKKFPEKEGDILPKCYRVLPMGTLEKPTLATRIAFSKKLLTRNIKLLADTECPDYEYIFRNNTNCEILLCSTNMSGTKKVVFKLKEKIP